MVANSNSDNSRVQFISSRPVRSLSLSFSLSPPDNHESPFCVLSKQNLNIHLDFFFPCVLIFFNYNVNIAENQRRRSVHFVGFLLLFALLNFSFALSLDMVC